MTLVTAVTMILIYTAFSVTPVTAVTFLEKVGAVSINEFPVFQKIPLYNNEVGEKKYSRILKNLKKFLDSRHVFKFCPHCFQTFRYSAVAGIAEHFCNFTLCISLLA